MESKNPIKFFYSSDSNLNLIAAKNMSGTGVIDTIGGVIEKVRAGMPVIVHLHQGDDPKTFLEHGESIAFVGLSNMGFENIGIKFYPYEATTFISVVKGITLETLKQTV